MATPTTETDLSGFGLERIEHIGRGQYATAQLVRETETGATYVAKCISLAALNDHDQELAHQEVFLLQNLSHRYIVAYRDSFLIEGANTLVIVMEHCDGGDLRKLIKDKAKTGEHFSEDQVMTWFVQLCLALQYCHSEKVLHRDLKTSNIFITEGGSVVKLGDFGISRVFEGTTEAAVTIVGTPYYMSPEVCRSEPYNWKSDVWALGCVLYELCMLKHAFQSSSLLGLVYKIVSDHYEPIPSFYSEKLNELIRQLLMKSAESRPSINDLFANPYVKSYLPKEAPPAPVPPPVAPPPAKRASLRPGGGARPPPPQQQTPPPPPPGPPPVGPEMGVLFIFARIRRRLVGQKLNWISVFASFDSEGTGMLSLDAMRSALDSMHLGISEVEISELIKTLAADPENKISLDNFSAHIREVAPDVLQCETWARQILAKPGRHVHEVLNAKDVELRGTLTPSIFQAALKELLPTVNDSQVEILVLLADKNFPGDVDYAEFLNAFAVPLTPDMLVPAGQPPLPPLPQGPVVATSPVGAAGSPGTTAVPPGMPPLPGTSPAAAGPAVGAQTPEPLNMTLTMGDVLVTPRTFFTCTTRSEAPGVVGTGQQLGVRLVSLSPQGCRLVFSRMKRRLELAHLSVADSLALFANPGERELSAEQCLDWVSVLPLGISRAEMQQLFSKLDANGTGRVPIATLEASMRSASTAECAHAPPWIGAAMGRDLPNRIREELRHRTVGVNGSAETLANEADFRHVVMRSERYLTADQLNSLVLLADKSACGRLDYEEFASRFQTSSAAAPMPLRVPGGLLPSSQTLISAAGAPAPSEDEIMVVASRTSAVLERSSVTPDRLSTLLALWGLDLNNDTVARLLPSLPLGLSVQEAVAQLQALGSLAAFVARLMEVRTQGIWKARCEWAAANIPGLALRNVLQRQVIEAESRTLDTAEFVRTLIDAGVAPANAGPATWLAEKTTQGDIRVAEFLTNFGGEPPAQKKSKGKLFQRIWGR